MERIPFHKDNHHSKQLATMEYQKCLSNFGKISDRSQVRKDILEFDLEGVPKILYLIRIHDTQTQGLATFPFELHHFE